MNEPGELADPAERAAARGAASERVDVAIAGGGPAGAAAALTLARRGFRVALIDSGRWRHAAGGVQGAGRDGSGSAATGEPAAVSPGWRAGEAVPADVRLELEALGVWPRFAAAGHLISRGTVSSWGGGGPRVRDGFFSPHGAGWLLDRERFDSDLLAAAAGTGVDVRRGARVTSVERCSAGRPGWLLRFAPNRGEPESRRVADRGAIAASLVIDATGRPAAVVRRLGVMARRLDRLVGVGAVFVWPDVAVTRCGHLLIEAAEDGWWYAAPLPGGRAMACRMGDGDLVRQGGLLRLAVWEARLESTVHIRRALGGTVRISGLHVAAAFSQRLERCAGAGWLAAGDAAAAFDPLSSAGIVLALRSGREAAAAAAAWLGGGSGGIGGAAAMAAYENRIFDRYERYLRGRRETYLAEPRWPAGEFWRRRQTAVVTRPQAWGDNVPAEAVPAEGGEGRTMHGSTRYGRAGRAAMAVLALVLALVAGPGGLARPARAQSPVITPQVSIDQDQLQAGKYELDKVLQSGGQFFSTPFIPFDPASGVGDGYGEGKFGPRNQQRKAFYPPDWPDYRFLRLNGLDSQSCYECHNSIGSYVPKGSQAEIRKPGSVGGSAGSNSNAFINPKFPQPITFFIRQPPHVFGSGYTQTLANEMTGDLAAEVEAARATVQGHRGKSITIDLQSKGMSFGKFTTTYTGGAARVVGCSELCTNVAPTFGAKGFTDNFKGTTGVACDLVVRPFQWKGISSSIRHFARDALDFHFSMQAVEKYGHLDCDKDGKIDEMTLGNVSALVAFVTMTRPPYQVIAKGQEHQVQLGQSIFEGRSGDAALQAKLSGQMCATCHTPALTVDKPSLFIDNPGIAQVTQKDCKTLDSGLVTPLPSHDRLEVYRLVQAPIQKARQEAVSNTQSPAHAMLLTQAAHPQAPEMAALVQQLRQAPAAAQQAEPGYTIDLTHPGPGDVPSYALPRLPAEDGKVAVPLFSDLRTHNMGRRLADRGAQGADVADICIPPPVFLTRPLWGVADTGPWLHDGRAQTLREAILMHEGLGSEANPVVAAFKKLSASEQQAVVDFLLTLQLPIEGDLPGGGTSAGR